MKIDIITLFPKMFQGPFDESIIKRACDKKLVEIKIHNLRKWTLDKHKTVDGRPYGGGIGMVMMIEPIDRALHDLKLKVKSKKLKVILLTPQGRVFNQKKALELSKNNHLILIAGHYEGFDERIRKLVDEEVSIGDYILTGGELPAMVIIDSIVRLIPGVLKKPAATKNESFSHFPLLTSRPTSHHSPSLLEFPQYTRPENFKGMKVPRVLLSGNHQEIAKWRKLKALAKTKKLRPDLL